MIDVFDKIYTRNGFVSLYNVLNRQVRPGLNWGSLQRCSDPLTGWKVYILSPRTHPLVTLRALLFGPSGLAITVVDGLVPIHCKRVWTAGHLRTEQGLF